MAQNSCFYCETISQYDNVWNGSESVVGGYLILSFFLLFPQSAIQKLGYPSRRPACYEDNVSRLVLKGQGWRSPDQFHPVGWQEHWQITKRSEYWAGGVSLANIEGASETKVKSCPFTLVSTRKWWSLHWSMAITRNLCYSTNLSANKTEKWRVGEKLIGRWRWLVTFSHM
jgi:hypothetical protein